MKFESAEQIKEYFNSIRLNWEGHPMGLRYSIEAKKAAVEFRGSNSLTLSEMVGLTGVSSFAKWVSEYSEGLYEDFSGLVGVSRKVKKSHSAAVEYLKGVKEKHEQEIVNIELQISAIRSLEEKGFKITKAA